jgi:hypothetical protein
VAGISVETLRDRRVAEVGHVEDLLGLMQQLGAICVRDWRPRPRGARTCGPPRPSAAKESGDAGRDGAIR